MRPAPARRSSERSTPGSPQGTELTAYRGTNPYLGKRWDAATRLFVEGEPTLAYPLEAWGYEQVGEVEAVGADVTAVAVGDVVWGIWGHRSAAVLAEARLAGHVLPAGSRPLCGVFPRIGAVALNAVLDADVHVGETVAVFGQGVPGLIAAQLARLNGGTVVAVDRHRPPARAGAEARRRARSSTRPRSLSPRRSRG